jgi:polar amino acid transport system permease protein
MGVWDILLTYHVAFARGLLVTLQLCAVVWSAGLVLGAALGVAGAALPRAVGWPSRAASFILAGVPVLVFLFWLHYPAQALAGVVIDPFVTAAATLAILNIVGVADVVRGALADFPQQYITAARVTGLTRWQTLARVQAPLILRAVIPPLLLLQVSMLHMTLFASLISVEEIFRAAQRINAQIYRPVEIYTALGVFFLAVSLPVTGLALWLRARYTRDTSEQ